MPAPDPLSQMRAEHVMISTGDYAGTLAWYQEKLNAGRELKDSRGLQDHTTMRDLAKKLSRRTAWNVVLAEQQKQQNAGTVDDELLSKRYRDAAAGSLLWARRVGLQDEAAAAELE